MSPEDRRLGERKLQNNFGRGTVEAAEVWQRPGGGQPTGTGAWVE